MGSLSEKPHVVERGHANQWAALAGVVGTGHCVQSTTAWENLEIRRAEPDAQKSVGTFGTTVATALVVPWILRHLRAAASRRHAPSLPPPAIMSGLEGIARPGEMVLVLTSTPSECTLFLQAIAHQLPASASATTTAGLKRSALSHGSAVFCSAVDIHPHLLTVEQLLRFRLRARFGRSPTEHDVIELLLRLFRIDHIRHTLIGNAIVRGISGGERRRLSVVEALLTGASVLSFDDLTRGLDSATALHCVKALHDVCQACRLTVFVGLSAASDRVFHCFDKVIAICQGRQVFFGPAAAARTHFESCYVPAVASDFDYLHACLAPAVTKAVVVTPLTESMSVDDLATSYKNSPLSETLAAQLAQHWLDSKPIEPAWSSRSNRRAGAFSRARLAIARARTLLERQTILAWKDRSALLLSWSLYLIIGLTTGLACFQLSLTGEGASARGGLIFSTAIAIAVSAQPEIHKTTLGRPLLQKVFSYGFERPAAFWTAQILVDALLDSMRVAMYAICVYFLSGLHASATSFFNYLAILYLLYLCNVLLNRVIGCMCRTFDDAIRTASFLFLFYMITAGYMVPQHAQPSWLRWTRWLNPQALAFSALMMNEFRDIRIDCQNPLTHSGSWQSRITCSLATAAENASVIPGRTYLQLEFSYDTHDKLKAILALFALTVFFFIANLILAETLKWQSPGTTIAYASKSRMNRAFERLYANLGRVSQPYRPESLAIGHLSFNKICYDVSSGGNKQQQRILSDISGYVKSGELMAIMGASGAGKTTLLNLLSGRERFDLQSGKVGMYSSLGEPLRTGYAEQVDTHAPTPTVREAMLFSARLRRPSHIPDSEKRAWVEHVISLLQLEALADAVIGIPGSGFGLSINDRKRVTIGVELAAKPDILFLDEPTTGLGSDGAFRIACLLRSLADNGHAVVCSIHQPSKYTLAQFDKVLMLHAGKTVYFGKLGPELCGPVDHIAQHSAPFPARDDPVEWMSTQIIFSAPANQRTWHDVWAGSTEAQMLQASLDDLPEAHASQHIQSDRYQTSVWAQTLHLTVRNTTALWRTPAYGFARCANHLVIALVIRVVLPNAGNSMRDMTHRILALWQTTLLAAFILTPVEFQYHAALRLFSKESATGTYGSTALALSMMIAELPYCVISTACFTLPILSLVAPLLFSRIAYFGISIFLVQIFCITWSQGIAVLTPNERIAALFNTPSLTIFTLMCGVAIPKSQLPVFLRTWLYYIDPFTWIMNGLITNGLHGFKIQCAENELLSFTAPHNQTCEQSIPGSMGASSRGYVVGSTPGTCQFCPFDTGDQYYDSLGLTYHRRWAYLGLFCIFCVTNICVILFALHIRARRQ